MSVGCVSMLFAGGARWTTVVFALPFLRCFRIFEGDYSTLQCGLLCEGMVVDDLDAWASVCEQCVFQLIIWAVFKCAESMFC